jgi:hypothetical protein
MRRIDSKVVQRYRSFVTGVETDVEEIFFFNGYEADLENEAAKLDTYVDIGRFPMPAPCFG